MGLARMERAKPMVVQTFDVVVTAEQFLLRHAYRRSYAHSDAGRRIGGGDLESPNLLCTRPDVYIESWGYAGPRCQGACAVRCDCIGSWPSGDVENKRAPDVHSAEWIERGTISVEPEALHNGFRYQVPT
jgi:hypothetical protein